ncbi:hypothetical protein [Noviherbaspirillum sp.]|uniref:hypothetical protein n=1 Tax=Noviherbaspirillum sp. TaxID=1926288 RepID=UPI002B4981B9|nr:hypothetical protein [Noviherbaspirillum sp.]HJV79845.1 hypothetical protein [Noviherbaspirillum sp.]
MKTGFNSKLSELMMVSAIAGALAGCGGGSSDTAQTPAPGTSHAISGSAAVGAPLVGSVTVKDALGATKTVAIGTNGAYSVDVTGMTAPFVFRASGTANGQTYTVHSIATAADADGKINITQLTDLVVANIAGQIAQNYYDRFEQSGNAGAGTTAAINAEAAKLKEKLLPVLTALGVEASVDLLRTPFTPLADKLDQALDAIQVSVDANTNIATISTLANAITIADDLRIKAAAETAPATLSADNVVDAAADMVRVKKAVTDFSDKFANALPSVSELTPLLTTGFLNDDQNSSEFLGWISSESNLVGGAFTDISVHQIDYSDPTKVTARVSFTVKTKQGIELGRLQNWRVRKSNTDGVWRLHGNQRALALEAFASMTKVVSASSASCVNLGFNFNIEDLNSTNNGGAIDHVLVTGAGLPPAGLRYNKPTTGGRWVNTVNGLTNYTLATDCGGTSAVSDDAIAAIPDDSVYTFTAYDSSDAKVSFPSGTSNGTYGIKIHRRPMTLAEAKASTAYPVISPDTVSAFSNFVSGTLQFSASNVNPSKSSWIHLIQNTAQNDATRDIEVTALPTTAGAVSANLALPSLQSGDNITSRKLWIESPDAYRRNMQTLYNQ